MDETISQELAKQYQQENIRLKMNLQEVHQELHDTNSELMQLTLDLDDQVAKRTEALHRSEQELRRHRDHLQEMVEIRTLSLKRLNATLKQKFKELAASEEQFRSLVATIPDIVYRIDDQGRFTFINDAIRKLGYEPTELLNQHFTSIIADDYHKDICRSSVLKQKQGQAPPIGTIKLFDERRTGKRKTTGLEIELLSRNRALVGNSEMEATYDERITVEVNSTGLYTEGDTLSDRNYIGTVGIIRDITTRKQLEDGLRKAKDDLEKKIEFRTRELTDKNREFLEEIKRRISAENQAIEAKKQWQEIFEAIGHTCFLLDAERNILAANRTACQMAGMKQDELINRKCFEIVHNTDAPVANCPFGQIFETREPVTRESEVLIGDKHCIVSCTPVYSQDGDLENVIHIATDITKIKKLEKELRQAQKMESLGTLAGGIAHDFNNILSIIIGYAELSESDREDDEELMENLEQINRASIRAKELIRQILTFARRTDERLHPIKIAPIAKETVRLLRSTIPTSIEIISNISTTSSVHANPTHIHQILLNLATNSKQAMSNDEGRLEIDIYDHAISQGNSEVESDLPPGYYTVIKVSDTGSGISPEQIDTIFEPYFTTKGLGEGTGLGLSVVHGIVENCKGKIMVESVVEQGTTFTIYLPASVSESEPAKSNNQILPGGSEHIYVVDDEPVIVKMLCRLLETLGYQTSSATSSLLALKEIRSRQDELDLVITDVSMPGLPGDKLADNLQQCCPSLPVILMTGYNPRLTSEHIRKIGAKTVIPKPLQKETLALTLRNILDGRRK